MAHHAMVAQYALNNPITLKGTLTKLEWMNPHSWIHLNVKGADGKVENWAIETGSPFQMEKQGLRKTDFQPGMDITIGGFLAKNGSRNVAGMYVVFPEREASSTPQPAVFALGRSSLAVNVAAAVETKPRSAIRDFGSKVVDTAQHALPPVD